MSPNDNIQFPDGSALPRPTEQDAGTYPNWKQIVPDAPITFTVALNPALLLDLAEAIGAGLGVILRFSDNKSPILVSVEGDKANGERGILMPMRLP